MMHSIRLKVRMQQETYYCRILSPMEKVFGVGRVVHQSKFITIIMVNK